MIQFWQATWEEQRLWLEFSLNSFGRELSAMLINTSHHATFVRKCLKKVLFWNPQYNSDYSFRPFEKIAIELVGEIVPRSDRGHRFISTVNDTCTRWVECVPLKFYKSEVIAESLYSIFCRMGFLYIILSDNSSQFVSRTTKIFTGMLFIAQSFCSIYHAASNGVIEKFHHCLQQMLSKVTSEYPKNWDQLLPVVVFAYNDTPLKWSSLILTPLYCSFIVFFYEPYLPSF